MAEDNDNTENVTHVNIGTTYNEDVTLHQGSNIASLEGGNDTVDGQGGVNIIDGGSGDDTSINLTGSPDSWDVVMGGSGDDTITGPSNGYLNARGGSGSDTIVGGSNSDYIFGDTGDDFLVGGGGDDLIVGGEGRDTLYGGSGSDTFVFGPNDGHDSINDFSVNDIIDLTNFGGTITWEQIQAGISTNLYGTTIDLTEWGGGSILLSGFPSDSLTQDMFNLPNGGSTGDASAVFQDPDVNTVYIGTSGDDTITITGTESVVVTGGEGDDTITGGSGDDFLKGGEGDDTLSGMAGNDLLIGGEGSDTLAGGAGGDWLTGGEGDDILTGGQGSDNFIFSPSQGDDTITDFVANEDIINLQLYEGLTSYDQLNIAQEGSNTVIDLSNEGGGTITLENVNVNDLDAEDFSFYVPPAEVDGI
ncbi:MAG: calcium-binding protein [Paracoccaceae bacterium]|nr:calcium-binding protein [Paracoccaceae bacterium]MDE2917727.1 calcium-binding protein [Paracoccaceae bacterium]